MVKFGVLVDRYYLTILLLSVALQVLSRGHFLTSLSNYIDDILLKGLQVLGPEGSGPSLVYIVFIFSSSDIGPHSTVGLHADNEVAISVISLSFTIAVGSST